MVRWGATPPVGKSGTWNLARYSNPEVEAAIKDAAATVGIDEKKAAYVTEWVNLTPAEVTSRRPELSGGNAGGWPPRVRWRREPISSSPMNRFRGSI